MEDMVYVCRGGVGVCGGYGIQRCGMGYRVWRWLRYGYRWYRGVVWGVEVVEVWDIGGIGVWRWLRYGYRWYRGVVWGVEVVEVWI